MAPPAAPGEDEAHPLQCQPLSADGKPSAVTLPDGRIYKNSGGMDALKAMRILVPPAAAQGFTLTKRVATRDGHTVLPAQPAPKQRDRAPASASSWMRRWAARPLGKRSTNSHVLRRSSAISTSRQSS